jgi:hypothetical protein
MAGGETTSRRGRCHRMENQPKQHGGGDLLELAARLRQSAAEANNEGYVVMLLSAALDLEARASALPDRRSELSAEDA